MSVFGFFVSAFGLCLLFASYMTIRDLENPGFIGWAKNRNPAALWILAITGASVGFNFDNFLEMPRNSSFLTEAGAVMGVIIMFFGFLALPFGMETKASDTLGRARLAKRKEILKKFSISEGVFFGYDAVHGEQSIRVVKETPLYYNGEGHLLTIAPARIGKGTNVIIPNLLAYPGSTVVLDPKGENASVTWRYRQSELGHKVYFLNPWGLHGLPNHKLNPLDFIDLNSEHYVDDVEMLADMLIFQSAADSGNEKYFNDQARAMLAGLLLYILFHEPPEKRNLPRLRSLLSQPPNKWMEMLNAMIESDQAGGLIMEAGGQILSRQQSTGKEAGSILSTAHRHLNFLKSPAMWKSLDQSDFSLSELTESRATIYVIIPPDRISTFSSWLRVILGLIITYKIRHPAAPRVLFIMDEFASLGQMKLIETGMGMFAGYRVTLWPFLQDMNQLKANYGEGMLTFFANAGLVQTFGTRDLETAKHLSELSGHRTVLTASFNPNGSSLSETATNLLRPDDIIRMGSHLQLVFSGNMEPIICGRAPYYEVPQFKKRYDRNPFYPTDASNPC